MTATVVRAQRPTSAEAGDTSRSCSATARSRASSAASAPSTACAPTRSQAHARPASRSCCGSCPFGDERDRPGGPRGRERGRRGDRPEPVPLGRRDRGLPRAGRCPRRACSSWATRRSRRAPAARRRARPRHRSPAAGDALEPRPGDLALVVAAHGRDELHALRRGLEAGLPYVGLVASRKRGDGVLGELRGDGVSEELLARIDVPAGLDIGARTPAEIALSILARSSRCAGARAGRPAAATAVDPICGMTVAAVAGTPSVRARRRDRLLLLRGLQGRVRARARACRAD